MEDNSDRTVPAVDPDSLRRWWDFVRETRAAWEKDHPGDTGAIGFDPAVIANVTGSSSPFAVVVRTSLVEIMHRRGLLGPWLEAGQPNESVFRLAAVWPVPSIEQFNPQEFLDQLRAG